MDASITSPPVSRHCYHHFNCWFNSLANEAKDPQDGAPGGVTVYVTWLKKKKKKKNMNCMSVTYPQVDPWNVKNKTSVQT